MGSLVLTGDQVFSESRFRYGFQLTEFRDQKSGLDPAVVRIYGQMHEVVEKAEVLV